jgi:hypothetical protein
MATSVVSLVNNALGLIGAEFITSMDDPKRAAQLAKQFFPDTRDAVLRAFSWNCVEKAVVLAPLAQTPPFKWAYQFQLPSDFLRVISIEESTEYKVQGRKLLANVNTISLTYIYREQDVSQYDPLLASCIEARLASQLAIPVLENTGLADAMLQLYTQRLREAKGIDSREKSQEQYEVEGWIESRYSNRFNRANR